MATIGFVRETIYIIRLDKTEVDALYNLLGTRNMRTRINTDEDDILNDLTRQLQKIIVAANGEPPCTM